MSSPYTVLGVSQDADDVTIRKRYLELTHQYPPEEHPQKSAAIRAAYDAIKTLDARVTHRLFDFVHDDGLDTIIEDLACLPPRKRPTLKELLKSVGVIGG